MATKEEAKVNIAKKCPNLPGNRCSPMYSMACF
jgi:hypothetical protein